MVIQHTKHACLHGMHQMPSLLHHQAPILTLLFNVPCTLKCNKFVAAAPALHVCHAPTSFFLQHQALKMTLNMSSSWGEWQLKGQQHWAGSSAQPPLQRWRTAPQCHASAGLPAASYPASAQPIAAHFLPASTNCRLYQPHQRQTAPT